MKWYEMVVKSVLNKKYEELTRVNKEDFFSKKVPNIKNSKWEDRASFFHT